MPESLVYAMHGFLGNSSDWNVLKSFLPEVDFIAAELFLKEQPKNQPIDYFLQRAKSFSSFQGKKIFLGYSLGGRLGLQLLKSNPELFDHYIFLSTHPGLKTTDLEERKNRILRDQKWSEKINEENWGSFLQEWNSQPVFQGSSTEPERHVGRYDLQKLKEGMVKWSLGKQQDFSNIIQLNNIKITWVVGERDEKYCALAENLAENSKGKKIVLNYKKVSSGHRIWLDNPAAVVEIIKKLI